VGSKDHTRGDAGGDVDDHPGPDAAVAVEIAGVTKRYGSTLAVDDVDIAVRDGEFFTFVGPSGCGKTTTLRLIAGFERPTAGHIRFAGRDVAGVPPEDRNVGVVFQRYALFSHMTVGENVGYGLRFSTPPGDVSATDRVHELLELVDLPGFFDRDPETLSGGQRQRVAIARALAPGPDVLLLDEPLSALDARLRERLRRQVRAIQRELGITTIYVTHDQEEALSVSDRVAVMHGGTVAQVAPPRTVYRRPASRFVAEFIGDNTVFTGTVADERPADIDSTSPPLLAVEVDDETFLLAVETDTAASSLRPGDPVAFCVRPHHLQIGGEKNAVRAVVESTEFVGETTRVHLRWGDRELLSHAETPPSGTVQVGFAPPDAHVIAGSTGPVSRDCGDTTYE